MVRKGSSAMDRRLTIFAALWLVGGFGCGDTGSDASPVAGSGGSGGSVPASDDGRRAVLVRQAQVVLPPLPAPGRSLTPLTMANDGIRYGRVASGRIARLRCR